MDLLVIVPLLVMLLIVIVQFWAVGLYGALGRDLYWFAMLVGSLLPWLSVIASLGGFLLGRSAERFSETVLGIEVRMIVQAFGLLGYLLFAAGFLGTCLRLRSLILRANDLERVAARSAARLAAIRSRRPMP